MAKKTAKKKQAKRKTGEQLELIDVGPENLKDILLKVTSYKKHQKGRLALLKLEIADKADVHELVKAAKLVPLKDGVIRFECDGKVITIEPRDEVIRIRDAKKAKAPKQ